MINQEKLNEIGNKLMNEMPEVEGIIFADNEGNILAGQTLTEMDHDKIVKTALEVLKDSISLSDAIDKGKLEVIYTCYERGYVVTVYSDKIILIALLGKDAASSLGLIVTAMKNTIKNILNNL